MKNGNSVRWMFNVHNIWSVKDFSLGKNKIDTIHIVDRDMRSTVCECYCTPTSKGTTVIGSVIDFASWMKLIDKNSAVPIDECNTNADLRDELCDPLLRIHEWMDAESWLLIDGWKCIKIIINDVDGHGRCTCGFLCENGSTFEKCISSRSVADWIVYGSVKRTLAAVQQDKQPAEDNVTVRALRYMQTELERIRREINSQFDQVKDNIEEIINQKGELK